jgi:hypothetical protein
MNDIISYTGKILFEPVNVTKKHENQANWKRVAMIVFDSNIEGYYRWFLERRFNLELNSTLRGTHITFINDKFENFNNGKGTDEEKEILWEQLKKKSNGKEITVTLNTRPFTDIKQNFKSNPSALVDTFRWWLIVDHRFREEIHSIRAELGLGPPYYGLHMTIGNLVQNYKLKQDGKLLLDEEGKKIPIFNRQLEHAKYICKLQDLGFIEINNDYGKNINIKKTWLKSMINTIYNMYTKVFIRF